MDFHVRFRFNKVTGEVEAFDVEDLGSGLPIEEHNRHHDLVASEIGRVIDRDPQVFEVSPGHMPDRPLKHDDQPDEAETLPEKPEEERE